MRCRRLLLGSTLVTLLALVACQGSGGDEPPSSASVAGTAVSSDGVSIRYEVHGQGEPTLIFVHGWSCDRSYWDKQVPFFATRHRVVTVDLAGHGDSGLERDEWTIPAFAGDVVAVLETLDVRHAVLLGHSMGGSVVVEAARLVPDRVGAVIGVDTFQGISRRLTDKQIEGFLAPLNEDFAEATRGFVRGMFVAGSDSLLRERIASDMASAPPDVAMEAMAHFFRFDLAEAMRGVDAPLGAVNAAKYPTDLEALREAAPGFKLEIMDGVGHFLMQEKPDEFNRTLNALLLDLASL